MTSLCTRCTRLSLRSEALPLWTPTTKRYRKFSQTRIARNDESKASEKAAKPESNKTSSSASRPEQSQATRQPLIRKTSSNNPTSQPSRTKPATPGGQVLRRTGPPQSGQVLRRSAPPQPGQVLRRTGQPGHGTPRGKPGTQTTSGAQRAAKPDRRIRRATARDDDDETDANVDTAVENYITKYLDQPPNPTEELPYNPEKLSMKELRADYPNTPLSQEGLSETVIQKIQWLARRLPHGYQTPQQLAERFNQGELVRFESEEEKKQVLEVASALSKAVAEKAEEEKGEVVKVEEATLTSLQSNETERSYLLDTIVKGSIEPLEKQRFPFLDNVSQALRNNETYGSAQSQKFLDRIYAIIPKGRAQQPQVQKQN